MAICNMAPGITDRMTLILSNLDRRVQLVHRMDHLPTYEKRNRNGVPEGKAVDLTGGHTWPVCHVLSFSAWDATFLEHLHRSS